MDERLLRNEPRCRGCGKPKPPQTRVCWQCFKYRTDVTPLKNFDGDLAAWLDHVEAQTRYRHSTTDTDVLEAASNGLRMVIRSRSCPDASLRSLAGVYFGLWVATKLLSGDPHQAEKAAFVLQHWAAGNLDELTQRLEEALRGAP